MRDQLVERVAFAIYRNFIKNDQRAAERWARMPELSRQRLRDDANAAIGEIEAVIGRLPEMGEAA